MSDDPRLPTEPWNLREIGLMSARILPRYEKVGLMKYFGGAAADQLSGERMIRELDQAA